MALVFKIEEIKADEYQVTLEIWPWGSSVNKKLLGIGLIANDGTASDGSGDSRIGNYTYEFRGKNGAKLKNGQGRIEGYRRKQHHPWRLIQIILNDMYKE